MKKVTNTKNSKKMGRPPANWLLDLKPGKYTLTELAKISNRTKGSIVTMLTRMGVKKEIGQHVCRNLHEVIYIWEGFDKNRNS